MCDCVVVLSVLLVRVEASHYWSHFDLHLMNCLTGLSPAFVVTELKSRSFS